MSKSVKVSLIANGFIATVKGVAIFFTGSASMMTEAKFTVWWIAEIKHSSL